MSNSIPAGAAGGSASPSRESKLAQALQLMQRALSLIDEADGPGDIEAHLDLAIARLKEWLESNGSRS
jgi:hypothetical protein